MLSQSPTDASSGEAFERELTKETIYLALGWLQGGLLCLRMWGSPE